MRARKITVARHPDTNRAKRWLVAFLNADGRRQVRFFATQAEADTYADVKKTELLNYGLKALSLPDDIRREAQQATELLLPHGKSLMDAARFYLGHLERNTKSCQIEELLKSFLVEKEADGVAARHLGDLKIRLKRFVGAFEGKVVSLFEPEEITDWLRALPVAPQTRHNFRSAVRNLFSYAVRRKFIDKNPVTDTPPIRIPDREVAIYTPEEVRLLLMNADPVIVPYLALGAFAGLRSAELLRLQWWDIYSQTGYVRVSGEIAKTGSKRIIPMMPNLQDWLRPMAGAVGKIVPEEQQWKLRPLLKAACEKAGVPWKKNALRHSFASYRLAYLGDAARTSLEMGNSPAIIFKHYRELVTTEQAAAYWNIRPVTEA